MSTTEIGCVWTNTNITFATAFNVVTMTDSMTAINPTRSVIDSVCQTAVWTG
ncbi:MAG: hypothetical protein ABJA02_12530 [Acidobacteriota bacterium]